MTFLQPKCVYIYLSDLQVALKNKTNYYNKLPRKKTHLEKFRRIMFRSKQKT